MNGILGEMVRRSLSIVMVLIMAGAPVAGDLCQVTCAEMAVSHASQAGQDHTACHHPDPEQGVHVAPMAHPCDHGDGLPAASTVSAVNIHPAAPLVVVVAGSSVDPVRAPRSDLTSPESNPPRPLEIRLVLQLRL